MGGFGPIQPVLEQQLFLGVQPMDRHGHDLKVGAGQQYLLDRGLAGVEVGQHLQHVFPLEHGAQGVVVPDDLAGEVQDQGGDAHLADQLRRRGAVVREDGVHEPLLVPGYADQTQKHRHQHEDGRAETHVPQRMVIVPDRAGQRQQRHGQEDQDPSISFHRRSFPARRKRITYVSPNSSSATCANWGVKTRLAPSSRPYMSFSRAMGSRLPSRV